MAGWLPEYALCILRPGWIWINTVHLPHTSSSSFSSLTIWLDLSFPPTVSYHQLTTAFLTRAVERVCDWVEVNEGCNFLAAASHWQILRYNIAAWQSLWMYVRLTVQSVCDCVCLCVRVCLMSYGQTSDHVSTMSQLFLFCVNRHAPSLLESSII